MAGGKQGGFFANIRNISTCEARSEGRKLPRQGILAEALVQLEWTQVDLEDRRPAFDFRGPSVNLTVEAARLHQSWVKDVRAVGAGQREDVRGRVESVHLQEQLVQGVLLLTLASKVPVATLPANLLGQRRKRMKIPFSNRRVKMCLFVK